MVERAAQHARKLLEHQERVGTAYQLLCAASVRPAIRSGTANTAGLHRCCCVKQGACHLPIQRGSASSPARVLATFRVETCVFPKLEDDLSSSVCRISVWFKDTQSIRQMRQSSKASTRDMGVLLLPEDKMVWIEVAAEDASALLAQRGMGTWGAALQQIGASKVADLLMMELAISCKPGSSELRLHFKEATRERMDRS